MKTVFSAKIKGLLAISLVLGLSACMSTTRSIDTGADVHYNAHYDFSDKKRIVDDLTASLLQADLAYSDKKPILIVYGIANQTSEHINTSGISDDIRLELIRAKRYRFLNKIQRDNINAEIAHQQSGAVAVADRIAQGRQIGADYILAGTMRSIEKKQPRAWRLNEKKMVYYSLNLELTNLTTGEIEWADKVELARESSKPIFRW